MNRTTVWALLAGIVVAATMAAAQQAPPRPVDFRPFADSKNWILRQPLIYRVGISSIGVTVPRGFATDFASIPPEFHSVVQHVAPNDP